MFDFPAAPALRATYVSGGITYQFDGTSWVELPAPVSVPTTIVGKRVQFATDNYVFPASDLEQTIVSLQYPVKFAGSSLVLTGGGNNSVGTGAVNIGWKLYLNNVAVQEGATRGTSDGDIATYIAAVCCARVAHGLLAGSVALCELRAYRDFSSVTLTVGSSGSPMLQVEELI